MINYELKKTNPASVSTDVDGQDTTRVVIGFTTGVVGTPDSYGMVAGDAITVDVANGSTKTQAQIDAVVVAAITAFIAQKYPST